jgi:hypothetical protein
MPTSTWGASRFLLPRAPRQYLAKPATDSDRFLLPLSSLVKPDIILGVMANAQTLLRAHLTGSPATERLYQTAGPEGRVLECRVWSGDYDLAYASAAAGKIGPAIPFPALAGRDYSIALNITGKK